MARVYRKQRVAFGQDRVQCVTRQGEAAGPQPRSFSLDTGYFASRIGRPMTGQITDTQSQTANISTTLAMMP